MGAGRTGSVRPAMTRILALSNMYPPHHLGGYELSCRDVLDRLRARGHDVTVLTTTMRVAGVDDEPDERSNGVHRELRFYWDDHRLLTPPLHRRVAIERANHATLARVIDGARPDVVSVWNMGAMSLGLLTAVQRRGLPMVLALCDDWLVYGPRLDPWIKPFADRPGLATVAARLAGVPAALPDLDRSDVVACVVSQFTLDRARRGSRWRLPGATVVGSGIDAGDFPVVAPPTEPKPWRWRLLYVGRLDDRKGVETLIRATGMLPADTTLSLVGRGDADYVERLRALAREAGVGDRMTVDAVPRQDLAARYRDADVLVFPSEWGEPFGLVPIEAMACGTPVIATGVGGSAEFLEDGVNCLRFEPGDETALAAAVERLAADADLRSRLVAAGAATAAARTTDRLADVFERWHVEAAARGRPSGP